MNFLLSVEVIKNMEIVKFGGIKGKEGNYFGGDFEIKYLCIC